MSVIKSVENLKAEELKGAIKKTSNLHHDKFRDNCS